ncbi:MAG: hypothetical protein KGL53_00110 [Elusimicrobia bacterium]|nr:hypothetical protein [Elusimicrobiota bacterium]
MAACRYCSCSSWLFALNPSGLCGNCEHLVSQELEQRARVLAESARGAEATQNPHTKLTRLDLAVAQLEALAVYERKGIATPVESPERRLKEAQRERDALLMKTAKDDLDATMRGVRDELDPERKAKLLSDLRLRLKDYQTRASSKGPLPALEKRARSAAWRVLLDARLNEARRADKAGEVPAAVRAYRQAQTLLSSPAASGPAAVEQRLQVAERLAALDAGAPG